MPLTIEKFWTQAGFTPNRQQRDAILHTEGPLLLTAGPGSGKTRVLLWRTVNLIVCHGVPAEDIFLGTFTEKAALQLRQGLTVYLSDATRLTGQPYDISRMPVGTVHSICRRILYSDRRFSPGRVRPDHPHLADELDQYFFLLKNWNKLLRAADFEPDGNAKINQYLTEKNSLSRHGAVAATISFFNRLSEECLDDEQATRSANDPVLKGLLRMYAEYRHIGPIDLSLLQQTALDHCRENEESRDILRHVIVDEYQDTNHVQESLFFHLASGHRNLCVVGDDDQALYRFRGSTVENLVEFEERCHKKLGCNPRTVNLGTNYRSRRKIVDFYSNFIQQIDWKKSRGQKGAYRVETKQIVAHSKDAGPSVVASKPAIPDEVCAEVASLVRRLLEEGKVSDPNQIVFLYPSLKSPQVPRMIAALEKQKLKVYAPRAGQFLDVSEAQDLLGVFLVLFGSGSCQRE
jgi:DNA helicase-2/ATP-dependent DNA helicase PcrA